MKKILLILALLPVIVLAQPVTVEKPVICDKTPRVLAALTSNDIKERPFWLGTDDESKFSLFVNEQTGAWTFIQFNDKIACILGTGENHKPVPMGNKS